MKAGYNLYAGFLLLALFWPAQAAAETLSGKYHLNNQNILISETQKYQGRFDLRSKLPVGDEFVLTKVEVSFKFHDDREWVRQPGRTSLKNTGKIRRHGDDALLANSIAGQTDYYYESQRTVNLSNEVEVAELTIGRNKYYGASRHRRDVTRESLGQKKVMLGTYGDEGDNNRLRHHVRITETVLETRRDGFDGAFEIRRKILDLASTQDLARTGLLAFELSGQGDYILVGATLLYEGYRTGQEAVEDSGDRMLATPVWLMLLSLPLGGLIWRKKRQPPVAKSQKAITRRKIPGQRAF